MKKAYLPHLGCAAAASLALITMSAKADTLAQWTFESTSVASTTSAFTYGSPETVLAGVTGSASGVHVSTASAWSVPVGDGSPHSFSANSWAMGDYFQFAVTPGSGFSLSSINVAYDQNGSTTGPKNFYFAYSTDGSSFTPVGSDYGLTSAVTWNGTTAGQPTHETFDLSAITALNTASTLYFRIVEDSLVANGSINGGSIGTGGTDRVDNFTVTADVTVVPEPGCLALMGGFGLLAWHMIRRRA